jgi:hypothetical protein
LATCQDCNTLPYHEPKAGAISVLLEIRDKSIRFMHEMRNAETGEIAAIREFTGVHLDRQAASPCRLPIRSEGPPQNGSPYPNRRAARSQPQGRAAG